MRASATLGEEWLVLRPSPTPCGPSARPGEGRAGVDHCATLAFVHMRCCAHYYCLSATYFECGLRARAYVRAIEKNAKPSASLVFLLLSILSNLHPPVFVWLFAADYILFPSSLVDRPVIRATLRFSLFLPTCTTNPSSLSGCSRPSEGLGNPACLPRSGMRDRDGRCSAQPSLPTTAFSREQNAATNNDLLFARATEPTFFVD